MDHLLSKENIRFQISVWRPLIICLSRAKVTMSRNIVKNSNSIGALCFAHVNSKHEYRNSKQIRIFKIQTSKFRISDLEFRISLRRAQGVGATFQDSRNPRSEERRVGKEC